MKNFAFKVKDIFMLNILQFISIFTQNYTRNYTILILTLFYTSYFMLKNGLGIINHIHHIHQKVAYIFLLDNFDEVNNLIYF